MAKPEKVDTAGEAMIVLTEAGYTDVSELEQHGATWHCEATNSGGEDCRVTIDGAGKCHEKPAVGGEEEAQPKA